VPVEERETLSFQKERGRVSVGGENTEEMEASPRQKRPLKKNASLPNKKVEGVCVKIGGKGKSPRLRPIDAKSIEKSSIWGKDRSRYGNGKRGGTKAAGHSIKA